MKTLRDLQAAATHRRWSTTAKMDAWLDEQHIRDPELRIAAKHYFEATGKFTPGRGDTISAQLATDQGLDYGLATDRARYTPATAPVGREMATLLRRAGVSLDRTYSEVEIGEALDRSGLDVTEKIAVRAELYDRRRVR